LLDALVQSGQAIAIADARRADLPLIFVNAAFETLTGYRADEVLGRNCRFLQCDGTDPATVQRLARAVAGLGQITVDLLNQRRDGARFWNRLHLAPVRGLDDQVLFYLGTQADVSAELALAEVSANLEAGRQELTATRERIRQTQAIAGAAGAWAWDVESDRLFTDVRFAELYGLDPAAAAQGLPTAAFYGPVHADDRMRLRIAVAGVMHGADIFTKEYRLVGPDGGVRWVSARGGADRDAYNQTLRFHGVLSDITEQKRIEEQLHVAQTAGGVGTFEYVAGFGTVSVSGQFCRLLGLQETDSLPVRTINGLVHPDDPPLIGGRESAEPLSYLECRILRADTAEVRWLARRGQHRNDGHTLGDRFLGVIYDITASKQAEAQLRQFAETLEARVAERTRERDRVWNNARELLAVFAPDGVLQAASPSWSQLLGRTPQPGESFFAGMDPGDAARMGLALPQGQLTNFEARHQAQDGASRWISWNTSQDDATIYAYGRDVTDEKAQDEALRVTEDQLRQAQKMEAVGQLTGGIAHDFNNMLTGVIGALDITRRRIAEGRYAELDRFMEAAVTSAQRAAGLTHRLLAFSRRQTLDTRALDVNALVVSMEDMLRRTLGEQVKLAVEIGPDVDLAVSDTNQLESAILNLAINARDAMPNGGVLTLRTANARIDAAEAALHDGASAGDHVVISVADTGQGMTPDVLAKVFEPFYTTKPIGQGTGLGLSMIYGFMTQTHGHVRIDSTPGVGTSISLYLPVYRGETGAAADEAQTIGEPLRGAGETVLVVEDDLTVRLLILEVLRELGYAALEAADSLEALPLLDSGRVIDLLITDVGLPGMNGRQLAEIARQNRPTLPVLFVTGYAANASVRGDFLGPGMDMVAKPFAMDQLATKIRDMLNG
jgi:PAS domain S-box-containing protein